MSIRPSSAIVNDTIYSKKNIFFHPFGIGLKCDFSLKVLRLECATLFNCFEQMLQFCHSGSPEGKDLYSFSLSCIFILHVPSVSFSMCYIRLFDCYGS